MVASAEQISGSGLPAQSLRSCLVLPAARMPYGEGLSTMKKSTLGLVLILLAVLSVLASFSTLSPPTAVDDQAAADRFSAARAWLHLQRIARQPHPMGTPEHAAVRAYLSDTLSALGVEPEIQTAAVAGFSWPPWEVAGTVHNVIARLPGSSSTGTVLLLAHYDSVPSSPGAGDDGAAVAALLETLRALQSGPQLRNDILFLFTDGEEVALLGAKAFVEQHRWAEQLDVVLNFEARGTEGPALMFQTNAPNRRMIEVLARSTPHPVGTSLSGEIYRRMPNNTDLTVFKPLGVLAMDFAFIHGESTYHTGQDELARLDRRSLQHHGDNALGLARELGSLDLSTELSSTHSSIYFNLSGLGLVTYPTTWALPLLALASVALVVLLVLGSRRRLSLLGMVSASLFHLLGTLLVTVLMYFLGQWLIGWGYVFSIWGGWSSLTLYLLGLGLSTLALALLFHRWRVKRQDADHLIAGGLLIWWLFAVFATLLVPGASYLFTLPLMLALLAAWPWLTGESQLDRERDEVLVGWPRVATLALATLLVCQLWPPILSLVGLALGSIGAAVAGLVLFLVLNTLLAPQLELARLSRLGRTLPALLLATGLLLIIATRISAHHGADNRGFSGLILVHDVDAGEAFWATPDRQPDSWARQLLGDTALQQQAPAYLAFSRRPMLWRIAAEVPPVAAAEVELLSRQPGDGGDRLEILIRWPAAVHQATVLLRSAGEIAFVSVEGQELRAGLDFGDGGQAARRALRYYAPPAAGIHLVVKADPATPLVVETVGQLYQLPPLNGAVPRLPDDTMPRRGWTYGSTYHRSQVVINADTEVAAAPAAAESPS